MRHRCQAAPSRTDPVAAFSPVCASGVTSCIPVRPRPRRERRKAVQNTPDSLSPTPDPRTSRRAVGADPGSDDHGLGGDPAAPAAPVPAGAGLAERGVQQHVRERRVRQGPVAERGDLDVQVRRSG
jgi:hypothetical protein